MLAGTALCLVTASPATAQTATPAASEAARSFNIPAQPLRDALHQLMRQGSLQIGFEAADVDGRTSSAVSGSMSVGEALSRLLAGTGLTFRYLTPGSVVLERAPQAADGAISLGPVRVEGESGSGGGYASISSDRNATEGTGRYTGSQTSTATRLPLTVKETPQSVTIVTRQRMDDFQMQSMQSVLLNVVGITENRSETERGKYLSRGFEITNMQIDGIASPFVGSAQWGTVSATQDSYLYDRIEVLRGATGMLSATGDPSATINMVRKKPGKEFAAAGFATVGSRDFYRGGVDLSVPITADGAVRARLIGVYQQGDSFRVRASEKRWLLSALVEADLTPTTLLRVVNAYQDSKSRGSTFSGFPLLYSDGARLDLPRPTNLSTTWSRWKKTDNRTELTLEQQIGERWKFVAAIGRTYTTSDPKVATLGGGFPDRSGEGMNFGVIRGDGWPAYAFNSYAPSTQWTYDAHLNGNFDLFGREHMLIFGVNGYRRKDLRYSGGFEPMDLSSVDTNIFTYAGIVPEPARVGSRRLARNEKYKMDGVFGSLRLSLADPLHVIVGGRVTNWRKSSALTDVNDDATLTTTFTENKPGRVFTPFFGATFDIIPQLTVYASYADLFTPQTERDVDGNVIDPIVGSNMEVGLKATLLDERLTINAALYEAKRDNVAELVMPEVILPDGDYAYRSVGKGLKTRGFEIEVSGAVTERWNIYAGFARNKTRLPTGELTNTLTPQRSFKLQTTWRPPVLDNRLSIGGGLTWQSAIWTDIDWLDTPGTFRWKQKAYAVASLMGRYQINDNVSVNLNVNNLFDKHYIGSAEFGGAYGEPRSILATVNVGF